MKNNETIFNQLNAYLLDHIQLQIDKCFRLIELGVGPYAREIAMLVKLRIHDLIQLASVLKEQLDNKTYSPDVLNHAIKTLAFYLDQEVFLADVGMLTSDNHYHRAAQNTAISQQALLHKITDACEMNADEDLSFSLRQYQAFSAKIALKNLLLILGLATIKLDEVTANIIEENSIPNGYYEQNREKIMACKVLCERILEQFTLEHGTLAQVEPLTIAPATEARKMWDEQMQRLRAGRTVENTFV